MDQEKKTPTMSDEIVVTAKEIEDPLKREFSFLVPKESIARELDTRVSVIAKTASLKGFRNGRAPRQLVEKNYMHKIVKILKKDIIGLAIHKAVESNNLKDRVSVVDLDKTYDELSISRSLDFSFSVCIVLKEEIENKEAEPCQEKKIEA